jgi:TetR/AcrR family transcriptional regulator
MVKKLVYTCKKKLKTEDKIFQAAMEVFIRKGPDGAKMHEIASQAGINKALLHYYFRSKENLYFKIFQTVFLHFFSELEKVYNEKLSLKTQLHAFINAYVNLLDKNHRIPLFIARELSQGGNTVSRIVTESLAQGKIRLPELLVSMLERAKRKGEIIDIDSRHFIMTLIGASIFFFVAEPIVFSILPREESFNRKHFLAQRKRAIFDVLYYGIKPR